MARIRNDYESSWFPRLLRWLKGGSDELDQELQAELVDAAHDGGDGLQEAGLGGGELRVHLVERGVLDHAVLREAEHAEVAVLGALVHGCVVLGGALLGAAPTAGLAHAAGVVAAGDEVARRDVVNERADLEHDAGALMAARHGVALVLAKAHPLLVVGGADIVGCHFDDDIFGAHFGERALVHFCLVAFYYDAKMNFLRKLIAHWFLVPPHKNLRLTP